MTADIDLSEEWRKAYEAQATAFDHLASRPGEPRVAEYQAEAERARSRAASAAQGRRSDDVPWIVPMEAIETLHRSLVYLQRLHDSEAQQLANDIAEALARIE